MFHAKAPSAKGVQPSLQDDEPCANGMFGVCCHPKTRENLVVDPSVFETATAEHTTTPLRFDAEKTDEDEWTLAPPGPAPTNPPKRSEQHTQATGTPRSERVSSNDAEEDGKIVEEEIGEEAELDIFGGEEEGNCLRAVFVAPFEKHPRVVRFTRRPLGFTLVSGTMPPTAGRVVSGHAHELGVRSEWTLLRLGNVAFGSDPGGFKAAAETCRKLAGDLPQDKAAELLPVGGSLEVLFTQREEALRPVQVVFHCQPLGLDFDRGVLPLTVLTAYGAAARLGVEPGWTVARFGGAELRADCAADFNEAIKVVKSLIAKLPQREHVPPETNGCALQ